MLFAVLPGMAVAQLDSAPAFPGAEGHGRYVTGGRGGKVVHVTSLDDNGPGSLRAAVKGDEKKIVVFDVAGVIALEKNLKIGQNTTIMGQTAPSPGITVRYYTVNPESNNIIRYMRFRRGQERDVNDGADASYARHKTGIILDHCSFSWSIDEVASFYDNNNFTMQWCTIAESLTNPGHSKGAHGYGGIWGGKLASFHHNLIAHVSNRGPRFNGARNGWDGYTENMRYGDYKWENTVQAENLDFRNCVMYNAQGTCYGGPGGGQINIVNNYYKAGPCGKGNQERITTVTVSAADNSVAGHPEHYGMTSRYYISGNTTETAAGKKTLNRDWRGISYDKGVFNIKGDMYSKDANNFYGKAVKHVANENGEKCVAVRMDKPCPSGHVTTHMTDKAFTKVLEFSGASLYRDDVDARYMKEVESGTATYTGSVTKKPGLIDVVADVNGYTEETFGTARHPEGYDTDGDGIPDEWEKAHGLSVGADNSATFTLDRKGWYTDLEVYCNSIVEHITKAERADSGSSFEEYYPID
ncbi:MAG: pectate lyase [Bacteroidales bacterium]|nr:pectate lyase [Bacteroidales bacterium]MCM1146553.1 pectate lyase [Bacteroidales bacterium]MCM1205945.1 pectate lyase [Bacillota bacterium]